MMGYCLEFSKFSCSYNLAKNLLPCTSKNVRISLFLYKMRLNDY